MYNRLYLIEGIPGAGKTTTARKLKEELESQGLQVNLYEEGMLHPADCSWQAFLSEQEYNDYKLQCRELWETSDKTYQWREIENAIDLQAVHEDDKIILAYTKIQFPEERYWNLVGTVAAKELCDGRSTLEDFQQIHLKRWKRFGEEAVNKEDIYIFECSFLQNHIFELMGIYEKPEEEIYEYLIELLHAVKGLNPTLIYLEPDSVEKVIAQAAQERKAPISQRKDWIDEIAVWVSNSTYGNHHGLKGMSGVVQFCKERMRIDKYVLERLTIPVRYIRRS